VSLNYSDRRIYEVIISGHNKYGLAKINSLASGPGLDRR